MTREREGVTREGGSDKGEGVTVIRERGNKEEETSKPETRQLIRLHRQNRLTASHQNITIMKQRRIRINRIAIAVVITTK